MEAMKRGRRSMRESDTLGVFGMIWVSGGGEDKAFGVLLDFVISFQLLGMNISRQLFLSAIGARYIPPLGLSGSVTGL